jgi:trimethylamine--corrinoid protein Co-methyltransferase
LGTATIARQEKSIEISEEVTPEEAPEVEMPTYDERGMGSLQNTGLGMYMKDPLTTANLGKIFVE